MSHDYKLISLPNLAKVLVTFSKKQSFLATFSKKRSFFTKDLDSTPLEH